MPNIIPLSQALILGIVQGITEFLPVSSTAHLRLIPRLAPQSLGWHDGGVAFDAALHTGTLLALLVYFWRDWIDVFRPLAAGLRGKTAPAHFGRNLLWGIIIGCIPAGIAGIALDDKLNAIEQNPTLNIQVMAVVAAALIVLGIVLYIADKYGSRSKRKLSEMGFMGFVVIGLAQATALIWGVSRSGATITAGRFRGLDRDAAARFSFLLSTPIFLGVAGLSLLKAAKNGLAPGELLPSVVGMAASAVVGFVVIKFLLGYLRRHNLNAFAWYRIALGAVILAMIAARIIV